MNGRGTVRPSTAPWSWGRRASFAGGLATIMIVATFLIPALGVLAAFIIEDLGINRTQFGWFVTLMAGATAAMATTAGRVADRFGARRVAVAVALLTALACATIASAPGLALMALAGPIAGAANAGGNPATNRLIADRLPAGRRGLVLGVKQSGVQVGYFVVGVLLPPLALAAGWRGALYAMAGFGLVVAALTLLVFEPDVIERPSETPALPYRYPGEVRWLAVYSVLMGAGGAAVSTFLPLYSQEDLGYGAAPAGATMSVIGVVGVASRVIVPRIAERRHRFISALTVMSWLSFFAIAAIALAGLGTRSLLWVGVAAAGASVVAWNAVVNLAALSVSTAQTAGRASGLVNMGFMGGYTLSPVVFGSVVDRSGSYLWAWTLVALLFVAAAGLMHVWSVRRRADRASHEQRYPSSPGADRP